MAHWIDRAALWLFTAFSALLFFLILTDGRLFISSFAAFFLVLLIRTVSQRLPDKHTIRRKNQKARVRHQLREWALMDEKEALSQIRSLLPELFEQDHSDTVHLLQRLPCESLSANQLLELYRTHRGDSPVLLFLCTCPISSEAAAISTELADPFVRLVGGDRIMQLLLPRARLLPELKTKKERRRPFAVRIAQSISSIRPVRSGVYALLFLALHLATKSRFYLVAAILFALQLAAFAVSRLFCPRRAL